MSLDNVTQDLSSLAMAPTLATMELVTPPMESASLESSMTIDLVMIRTTAL